MLSGQWEALSYNMSLRYSVKVARPPAETGGSLPATLVACCLSEQQCVKKQNEKTHCHFQRKSRSVIT